ncbi:PREDICTED: coiled-coil domain-containing protein 38 [Chrysochloris asiatica]|uniref:Coiled-coil domain-containing protein 38 n=1 Tax=Chrysochloris asiatica TaxID=185453 RepID=A0A9B0WYF9_CHRAS|nr:PREDICTED: coiled-coil domain-containing protein 38 [Chrysochloris asiatica]
MKEATEAGAAAGLLLLGPRGRQAGATDFTVGQLGSRMSYKTPRNEGEPGPGRVKRSPRTDWRSCPPFPNSFLKDWLQILEDPNSLRKHAVQKFNFLYFFLTEMSMTLKPLNLLGWSTTLSPLLSSGDKLQDAPIEMDKPYRIFFKDLFLFKENEMAEKKKEKFMSRSMKVHQKSTFSSRMKSRSHLGQIDFYADTAGGSPENFGFDPMLILRLTEGADTSKTVHEFINDQRDGFLLEFTMSTKRKTIRKFEDRIASKERQLMKAEKKLQDDAIAFEEFLRENDQKSVDAIKIAAQETINKLQTAAELKKASMEVQAVKSEIAKTEFLLKEYMKYGFFLLELSPRHWQAQQALKRVKESKSKDNISNILPKLLTKSLVSGKRKESIVEESRKMSFSDVSSGISIHGKLRDLGLHSQNRPESISSEDSMEFLLDDDMEYNLAPELYFKEPEELLQVLTELEEQNLTLVQYAQDVDENLEDVIKREKMIQDKIKSNIEFLLEHKAMLKANCVREEEKAAELELRSRLFNFGEFNSEVQEQLIDSLNKKINQVYRVCIGEAEVGSLNPVQKLVKVESRLVELSDLIESVPKEHVEAIEKLKQKERRLKLREEKMKEKQKHQEERLKAALERAVAQPKKKLGRRLIFRSSPPSDNKHELQVVSESTKSQEEEYFFT